jgi:hypothetical protein
VLREAQVMSIRGLPAANQAGLLGNCLDVGSVAKAARRRNSQQAPIDHLGERSIVRCGSMIPARQVFGWGLLYRVASARLQGRQFGVEGILDASSISLDQVVLDAQIPTRADCGFITGAKVVELGEKSIA